jgi:glycine betaine catabolism B
MDSSITDPMKAGQLILQLIKKEKVTAGIYMFYFASTNEFRFTAGQYIQLSIPHDADERGRTRFFSLSSSPEEKHIMLTIKEGKSSFKEMLFAMEPGATIDAFGPMGKFTLED